MKITARKIACIAVGITALPGLALASPFEALKTTQGEWSGTLTYRDFQTDQRVSIPHERTIHVGPNGTYALHQNVFTDPGYQVFSAQMMTATETTISVASTSDDGIETENYTIIDEQRNGGVWRAAAIAKGRDDGRDVTVRLNLTISDDLLIFERNVKSQNDEDFRFRNAIKLERKGSSQ